MIRIKNYITICLLLMFGQVFSQGLCQPSFISAVITNATCNNFDGAIDITLTGGVEPFSFEWKKGSWNAATEDIAGLEAGSYRVIVTDGIGQTCISYITVYDNGPACNISVLEAFCDGVGTIAVDCEGGTPPYTYLWHDGSTDSIIENTGLENFKVTVTDAIGCLSHESLNLSGTTEYYCDSLCIDPIQSTFGNQIRVDVVANNYTNISSVQYRLSFDHSILQLESLENINTDTGMGQNSFATPLPGQLTFVWYNVGGASLSDGEVLYSIYFTPIAQGSTSIYVDRNPEVYGPIPEVSNNVGEILYLCSAPLEVIVEGNLVNGNVYHDVNEDCINFNEPGLSEWLVSISDGANDYNVITDSNGDYSVILEGGTYTISATPISEVWSICNNVSTIEVNEAITYDIGVEGLVECPVMEVDLAMPFIARCFDNLIYVDYSNIGSVTAEDAYIVVELDEFMVYQNSTITPSSINGNELTFDLGDIPTFASGTFHMTVLLDENCDETVLAQTHCTTATIFPNAPCIVDALWSGASLNVSGSCDSENVNFVITNIGENDMNQTSSFIVIEDHVMGQSIPEDFMLATGESLTITQPANGSTYYFSVNQVSNHPGQSNPSIAVEGCGTNANGEISQGIITQYEQDDQNSFVDIECIQNVGSYDPNDKRAMLEGFGEENYIYANTPMEYMIRFQNTGTFTAFNVVIEDELSPFFDITTLRPGASSHDYTFSINEERNMVFTFENINLPDSMADLAGSNGFVTYKVDQLLDNPDGTVLDNTAAIFFDFNEPILTNTTTHTIGSDFIMTNIIDLPELGIKNAISVFPNPSTDMVTFELENPIEDLELQIYDVSGSLILEREFASEKIILSKNEMTEGMYFYSILTKGQQLTSGKFVLL